MIKEGFYKDDFTGTTSMIKNGKVYVVHDMDCQVGMTEDGIVGVFDIEDANAPENQDWINGREYTFSKKVTLDFPWSEKPVELTIKDIDTTKAVSSGELFDLNEKYDWEAIY